MRLPVALAALAAALAMAVPVPVHAGQTASPADEQRANQLADATTVLLVKERKARKRTALVRKQRLDKIAEARGEWLVSHRLLCKRTPKRCLARPDLLRRNGYRARVQALVSVTATASASPTKAFRAAKGLLRSRAYRDFGVGAGCQGSGRCVVVVILAARA